MKTLIYYRVSTTEQDLESQAHGVKAYLASHSITKFQTFEDKISGSVPWDRRLLLEAFHQATKGDQIIVSEISRIGRSVADVLSFLQAAAEKGIIVIAVKNNITFDGGINSKIFATVLALAAEIERDFIRLRTREGMANAKAKGTKLGRPIGRQEWHQLDSEAESIARMLQAQVPKSAIARILGVARSTLQRYLDRKES
jgi:DNA invertase Pin-like site-specific DNA recombinase